MSWMQRLYETYENALALNIPNDQKVMPISHTIQNAHINIVIDTQGNFLSAKVMSKKTQIVLPATESSAGRSSGEAPHPLADKLQYVAKDYTNFGGQKNAYYNGYENLLRSWCESKHSHPQVRAVLSYVRKGKVIEDLVSHKIVFVDIENKLITNWTDKTNPAPSLFSVLPKERGELDQGSAMVCWTVESDGYLEADTWKDNTIQSSWIDFEAEEAADIGFCYVNGNDAIISTNHPAKLRHSGDKAKLVSANDSSGFTYRGKFLESHQASSVAFVVTQKAHNVLRWLISRQGVRNGDQVIVTWAASGRFVPNPMLDPYNFSMSEEDDLSWSASQLEEVANIELSSDLGQRVAKKFKLKLKGYQQQLTETEQLSILTLDSATPGRMSITHYQEQMPDTYFKNLDCWYENFSWFQRCIFEEVQLKNKKPKAKVVWIPIAPSPYAIAQTAYGATLSDSLKKQIYSRILPCISDGKLFPIDIVNQCVARASNSNSGEHWEWERNIGVACALYRGFYNQRNSERKLTMGLDINNASRDYLYGRLLAVAEKIEQIALSLAGEKRRTTAERFMQKFAERPFSTWRNIELALDPYKARLKNNRTGFLVNREKEITQIMDLFSGSAFCDDKKLSGEFLLGYHSQKMTYQKNEKSEDSLELENV